MADSVVEGVTMKFDLDEEMQTLSDKKFLQDLLEEEERKLYEVTDENNDLFFNGKEYRDLLEECGYTTANTLVGLEHIEDDDRSTPLVDFKLLTKNMVDISDGQKLVFKRLISKGEGLKIPSGALVVYNYKFYHEHNPEPFDTSQFRVRPDRQRVGVGQLIAGVDHALQSMCKKERALFVLDYRVMFGKQGVPPRIPKSADIFAEIEVINYTEKNLIDEFFFKTPEEQREMSFNELIALVQQCRDDANSAVRTKRYAFALTKYARGLDILFAIPVDDDDAEKKRDAQINKFNLNMALCYLKLSRGPSVIKACNNVLAKHPHNVKALYRKAKGLMIIGSYSEAASCLRRANQLSSNNREIMQAISENEELKRANHESSKELAKAMLNMKMDNELLSDSASRRKPNMESDIAKQLRKQILEFIEMNDLQSLEKLKGCSVDEVEILKTLCVEFGLECIEKDGIIIRKKSS